MYSVLSNNNNKKKKEYLRNVYFCASNRGSPAPGQRGGQWTVSIFHGTFKSFVCVCLIALLPQARQRQRDKGRRDRDDETWRERESEGRYDTGTQKEQKTGWRTYVKNKTTVCE